MISGEYLVLRGALSLALPIRFGQALLVSRQAQADSTIKWDTYIFNKLWFSGRFDPENFDIIGSDNYRAAEFVSKCMKAAQKLNPDFQPGKRPCNVKSVINFDINYGFGSSSSLISNIAYWSKTDPYQLHEAVANGSGYDVACARAERAIFFRKESSGYLIEDAGFNPPFKDDIYFVYLGRKQDSSGSVARFNRESDVSDDIIREISQISAEFSKTDNIDDFNLLIERHEQILSDVLRTAKIKDEFFQDFDGCVKSLGAWGGDFAMFTWKGEKEDLIDYINNKGLKVIYSYEDLLIKRK